MPLDTDSIAMTEQSSINAPIRPMKLTPRELGVLEAVAGGFSNREIGARLQISDQTVKKYVSVLIQKFYVRNRVHLAVLWHSNRRSYSAAEASAGTVEPKFSAARASP
jgi:two-component system, NarL family, response regulator LiaR